MDATATPEAPVNDGFINSIEDAFSGFDAIAIF